MTKSDTALKDISNALFPPRYKDKRGVMVDSDSYYELEGVVQDLKAGVGDGACIRTIEQIQARLVTVSNILERVGVKTP